MSFCECLVNPECGAEYEEAMRDSITHSLKHNAYN